MIDGAQLRELSLHRQAEQAARCICKGLQVAAWESITDARWPSEVTQVATLRAENEDKPTFEEFHPKGTRYDSAEAPIACAWFPFNRCDVYLCGRCRSAFLRYTEFGGYYVDHRVRLIDPQLIV